jgi:hypothetical protein
VAAKGCLLNPTNTTDWQLDAALNTNLTILERRATTVFDRSNLTIIDILSISDPTPTNYTTDDFFTFYDILFAVNETEAFYKSTVQYSLVSILWAVINSNSDGQNWFDIGGVTVVSDLQQVLATIPLVFNSMYWEFPPNFTVDLNLGKSIALAIPRYRVAPRPPLFCLSLVNHRTIFPLHLYSRWAAISCMVPRNTVVYHV